MSDIDSNLIRPSAARTAEPLRGRGPVRTIFDDDRMGRAPEFGIDEAADRVMAKYDRNADGAVTFDGGGESEAIRDTPFGERSIERLARAADHRGNADGTATLQEIKDFMGNYDWRSDDRRGGDGSLGGFERGVFISNYGETGPGMPPGDGRLPAVARPKEDGAPVPPPPPTLPSEPGPRAKPDDEPVICSLPIPVRRDELA